MCSAAFVQAVTTHLKDRGFVIAPEEDCVKFWGTLWRCQLTLFKCVTGGIDWNDAAESLIDVGSFYPYVLYSYIAFWTLVMANALNALFVDSVMNFSAKDDALVIENKLHQKEELKDNLSALFNYINKDNCR